MNKSSKLLTLVAAASVFVALGTGIAFAYSSGYHSGAAATPATTAALVAPTTSAATPVNAALFVTPVTAAATALAPAANTATTARVIPPQPGPGYHWDANNWCWNAPTAPTGTPSTARVIPPKPGPGYHWDADNWCWNAPVAPTSTTPTTTPSSPAPHDGQTHHDGQTYHHAGTGDQGCR